MEPNVYRFATATRSISPQFRRQKASFKVLAVYRAEVFYRISLAVLCPVRTVQRHTLSVSYESYRTLVNLFGIKIENRLQQLLQIYNENT